MLDAGTTSRPHISQPFRETAINRIIAEIAASLGDDTFARAVRTGGALTDDDLAERTLELIHEATAAGRVDTA